MYTIKTNSKIIIALILVLCFIMNVVTINAQEIETGSLIDTNIDTENQITSWNDIMLPTNAVITDSDMISEKHKIFLIDNYNRKLYSIDIKTGTYSELLFDYYPERMAISKNELYVTLVPTQRTSVVKKLGLMAIIDVDTLIIKDIIELGIDPYDIEVDQSGYIYVVSSADFCLKIYPSIDKEPIVYPSNTDFYCSKLHFNNSLNKLYCIKDSRNAPIYDILAYSIVDGEITNKENIKFPGSTPSFYFKASPDEKYIFLSRGDILNLNDKDRKEGFCYTLNRYFTDITFDLTNNVFYTVNNNKLIYSYDYFTFESLDAFECKGNASAVFYIDNAIFTLSTYLNGRKFIEKIDIAKDTETSEPSADIKEDLLQPIEGDNGSYIYQWDYQIADSVLNADENIIYFVDNSRKLLCSINYYSNILKTVELPYEPSLIDYYNGDLIVGCAGTTKLYIYNAETFEYKSIINTEEPYYDLAIGNDGYLYTSGPNKFESFSLKSMQQIDLEYIVYMKTDLDYLYSGTIKKLILNSTRNSLYFYDEVVYCLKECSYDKGEMYFDRKYPSNDEQVYLNGLSKISPDGKYLFNSRQGIFYIDELAVNGIKYVSKFPGETFADICFDADNNRIYSASSLSRNIEEYDLTTFAPIDKINLANIAQFIYYKEGKILALSNNGLEVIEKEKSDLPIETKLLIGDVNEDGSIDSLDAAIMRKMLLGLLIDFPTQNGALAADVNGDETFDSLDFAYMRKYLLGKIRAFPAEGM